MLFSMTFNFAPDAKDYLKKYPSDEFHGPNNDSFACLFKSYPI